MATSFGKSALRGATDLLFFMSNDRAEGAEENGQQSHQHEAAVCHGHSLGRGGDAPRAIGGGRRLGAGGRGGGCAFGPHFPARRLRPQRRQNIGQHVPRGHLDTSTIRDGDSPTTDQPTNDQPLLTPQSSSIYRSTFPNYIAIAQRL